MSDAYEMLGFSPCKVTMTGMGRTDDQIYHATQMSMIKFRTAENSGHTQKSISKFPYFIIHHQVSIKICKIPSQFFVVSRAVHIYIL